MIKYNEQLTPELNLLNALIHIKENIDDMPNCGICPTITRWAVGLNIHSYSDRKAVTDTLERLVKSWPNGWCYNGHPSENWPVGGSEEYEYKQSRDILWQNPRRLELLDYLIDQLSVNQ